MTIKTAVITGISGQSASYLAELLIENGYVVYGIYRRTTSPSFQNLKTIISNPNLKLVCGDITDAGFVFSCLSGIKPDEIYNLAAQSFVKISFEQPSHTFDVDTVGVLNMLEWVRQNSPKTKFYQASTSEMFGKSKSMNYSFTFDAAGPYTEKLTLENNKVWRNLPPDYVSPPPYIQNENTPFIPQSPYAIAKLAAHHLCRLYREAYGLFIVSNITFNHESPRRGKEFVTRKITDYIGRLVNSGNVIQEKTKIEISRKPIRGIKANDIIYDEHTSMSTNLRELFPNLFPKLALGNIYASRDWGHAKDFMDAAYLAMQHSSPDDYVVCTGKTNTVEGFLSIAFGHVGLDWKDYVVIDEAHKRPAEVDFLNGDYSKIKRILGWEPTVTFEQLIKEMVEYDIKAYYDEK